MAEITSQAIYVHDAYKQFGNPVFHLGKRLPRLNGRLDGKSGSNGHAQVVAAVDHVSFSVEPGEIFGLLGPEGAGKSTLIRLLATLLLPDSGEMRVFGYDVSRQSVQVQRLVNRVSVEASFFKKLSPIDNLLYGARLSGMRGSVTRHQILETLTRLGLEGSAIHAPMETMPRSEQQKVFIARALLSCPPLLLLDEPANGLDLAAKGELQAMLNELRQEHGVTTFFATRDMVDANNFCDRIARMEHGKLIALDTPQGLGLSLSSSGQNSGLEGVFFWDDLLIQTRYGG